MDSSWLGILLSWIIMSVLMCVVYFVVNRSSATHPNVMPYALYLLTAVALIIVVGMSIAGLIAAVHTTGDKLPDP